MKHDVLTGVVRHEVELLPPVGSDYDFLFRDPSLRRLKANTVGMLDHLLHLVLVQRVEDVEEVDAIGEFSFGEAVGHVLHEVGVRLVLREEVGYRYLVVLGRVDPLDILEREQLLPVVQDLLEEVFVDHGVRWDVELKTL